MKTYLVAFGLLLSLVSSATAQTSDSLSTFFDEGSKRSSRFAVKVGGLAFLNGEQAVHVEVRPFSLVSFELAAGLITDNYLYELEFDPFAEDELGERVESGNMVGGRVKLYNDVGDIFGYYSSIGFYRKKIEWVNGEATLYYYEPSLEYGVVFYPIGRVLLDFSVGVRSRVREIQSDQSNTYSAENSILVPISLKAGYAF